MNPTASPLIVTSSEYLAARVPAWLDEERLGRVRFDAEAGVVRINPAAAAVVRRLLERKERHG